jgi:PST family polysaccharide transporter
MSQKSSYGEILKASSIMGGAAGVNLLLSMVRTKFAAVLIGTSGVGLMASFSTLQGLIGSLAGLGIQSSGVRDVAAAVANGDEKAVGRTVVTLRRICWLTGLVGMFVMMLFSPLLSQLTFASDYYTYDIAALGIIILFGNLTGGQMALIQGTRRIGDIARANIIGAAFGTGIAIGFYSLWGLRGIVPTLVAAASFQLGLSWFYARRIPVPVVTLSWKATFIEANGMVRLGIVFMWTGLMGSAVSYITITLITQQINLQAVGIYSAAFALSGVFVNFVLGAMSADYYPRLTGVANDKAAMNRLVNEQTEIGLLLATPGLLATIALAPWVIRIFYTNEFLPAVELLQWFTLGCLGRVISWPLGFVMLALGKSAWLFGSELFMNILHLILISMGISTFGLNGVALAFLILYIIHIPVTYYIAGVLTEFKWSLSVKKIGIQYGVITLTLLIISFTLSKNMTAILGGAFAFLLFIHSLKKLRYRLDPLSKISFILDKIPFLRPS